MTEPVQFSAPVPRCRGANVSDNRHPQLVMWHLVNLVNCQVPRSQECQDEVRSQAGSNLAQVPECVCLCVYICHHSSCHPSSRAVRRHLVDIFNCQVPRSQECQKCQEKEKKFRRPVQFSRLCSSHHSSLSCVHPTTRRPPQLP
jgi:hypothetical protein